MKHLFSYLLCTTFLLNGALQAEESAEPASLPAIAATYITTVTPTLAPALAATSTIAQQNLVTADSDQTPWFFLRDSKNIEIREANMGEHWFRLNDDSLAYSWIHHAEQIVVTYTPADLNILAMESHWSQRASLLDLAVLEKLKISGDSHWLSLPVTIYAGSLHGQQLEVHWLNDYGVPARIIQQNQDAIMIIALQEISPLDSSAHQFSNLDSYQEIDYVDLGDNETHPVARFISQGQHSH